MAAARTSNGPAGQRRPRSLRVGVLLGDQFVEERLFRDPQTVTIGQSAKNTFAVPIEDMPRSWPLFGWQSGGYLLYFNDAMDGRISAGDGQVLTLDALKGRGAKQHGAGWVVPLSETARGKIEVGQMKLLFQFVTAPPVQPKAHLPPSLRGNMADRIERPLADLLAVFVTVAVLLMIFAYRTDRVVDTRSARVFQSTFERPTVALIDPLQRPTEPEPGEATTVPAEEQPEEATAADTPPPKQVDRAPAGGGGRDVADPVRLDEDIARMVNALTGGGDDGAGPLAGMRGTDPGDKLNQTIADIEERGDEVRMGGGGDDRVRGSGSTQIGTGRGPDLQGEGTTVAAAPRKPEEPRGRITAAGSRSLDQTTLTPDAVVRRILSTYMTQLQRCQAELLKRDPSASGRVTLNFTVNESGRVVRPSAKGFDPSVDSCIESRMASWTFPIPREDGHAVDATFNITLALQTN